MKLEITPKNATIKADSRSIADNDAATVARNLLRNQGYAYKTFTPVGRSASRFVHVGRFEEQWERD